MRDRQTCANDQGPGPDSSVVAEGATDGLREMQRTLAAAGIAAEIVRPPPKHCTSGG